MKKLLVYLFFAAFIAQAQTVVQSTAYNYNRGSVTTLTLPSPPLVGDLLVVAFGGEGAAFTPPDRTWQPLAFQNNPGATALQVMSHVVRPGDGVTYSFPGPNYNALMYQIHGYQVVNSIAVNATSGAPSSATTPSVTPTVSPTLALAFQSTNDGPGTQVPAGWLGTISQVPNGYHPVTGAVRTALTSGTATPVSATFTGGGGSGTVQAILLFLPSSIAPVLNLGTLPGGTVGVPYNAALPIIGGTPAYSCSLASPLPPGLALSPACIVSGIPLAAGTFSPTISATDSTATTGTGTQTVALTVIPATPVTFSSALAGQVGTYINSSFMVAGGNPPYTCTITSGALPAGLVKSGCGILSTPSASGTSSFQLTVSDSSSPAVTASGIVTAQIASAAPPLPLSAGANMTVGALGSLGGFVMSPNDAWHANVSHAVVDPLSNKILVSGGGNDLIGAHLHPDFGAYGAGIPYTVVDSSVTPGVPLTWTFNYQAPEGDTTLFPIPSNMEIEGAPAECPLDGNDRHANVIDKHTLVVYELYQAGHCSSAAWNTSDPGYPKGINFNAAGSGWHAGNGAIWDMTQTQYRPYTDTSVDAAGLSVFEGLLTYDDILRGYVNHAIRFTSRYTKCDHYDQGDGQGSFIAPATHAACNSGGTDMAIGLRIRLKSSFDVSGYSATNQIILNGMKQYGMILADNGSNMFFQGTPDKRWNDGDINNLKAIGADAFEVLAMAPNYNNDILPKGSAPSIKSFIASPTTVSAGAPVTLSANVSGASYSYIDNAGFLRGSITVNPTVTTTYTLVSSNIYGRVTSSPIVVTVTGGAPPALHLTSIAVTPSIATGNIGGSQPLVATGTYSNATTSNITNLVTFSSSNPGVATVAGNSILYVSAGTATVTATSNGLTSPGSTFTVLPTVLTSITLTPPAAAVVINGPTLNLAANARYSDGSTRDVTASATWVSSNPAIASVAIGTVTASAVGSVNISASVGQVTSPATSIAVAPDPKLGTSGGNVIIGGNVQ